MDKVIVLMKKTWLFTLTFSSSLVFAQTSGMVGNKNSAVNTEKSVSKLNTSEHAKKEELQTEAVSVRIDTGASKAKPSTKMSKRELCRSFENKYVSYYSKVFKIKNCSRHPVPSDLVYQVTRSGMPVQDVSAYVIEMIPLGSELKDSVKLKSCRELEGKYITFAFGDIYLIENCIKRPFPDWESVSEHQNQRVKEEILSLKWEEFAKIPEGQEMPSVIDAEYKKNGSLYEDFDILPVSVACRGLEGKFAIYYSKVYKIEKCHRRPIDPEEFSQLGGLSNTTVIELDSQIWVSLPVGKPYQYKR